MGEKLLLRELARRLNLGDIGGLEKRAIQFGSRIAKMSEKSKRSFMSRFCQVLIEHAVQLLNFRILG